MHVDRTFRLIVIAHEDHVAQANRVIAHLRPFGATEVRKIRLAGGTDAGWEDGIGDGALSACLKVEKLLNEWSKDDDPPSTLIYWTGHGETQADKHWLLTSDSIRPHQPGHSFKTRGLADALELNDHRRRDAQARRWTALIIDSCSASVGIREISRELLDEPPPEGIGLLGSAGRNWEFEGRFALGLCHVVGRYGVNDDLHIERLLSELQQELRSGGADYKAFQLDHSVHVLTNPHRADQDAATPITAIADVLPDLVKLLQELPAETRSHFVAKAQAGEMGEQAWYFQGRGPETEQLARWLTESPGGMFITTGLAGSGKSAFLGRALLLADPDLVNALVRARWLTERPPTAQLPPARCFDVAVHLTGKSLADATARIADAVPGYTGAPDDIEAVLTALTAHGRTERFTVLADALDEAREPMAIAGSLLRRLAAVSGVRVVVGTRQSLDERPDHPEPPNRYLIEALAPRADHEELMLDDDRDAQHAYVEQRLRDGHGYPPTDAADLATEVVSRGQPFLFARLAVTEVSARALSPGDPQLASLLGGGHAGLFARALQRFDQADAHTTALLRALAYAFGRGFPQADQIWTTAARALHPHLAITEASVDRTLDLAAPYIAVDGEFGQTTYRLAHYTYDEHFHHETTP